MNSSINLNLVKNSIDKTFKNYPAYYKPDVIKSIKQLPKTFNGKKLRDVKKLIKY